MSIRRGTGVFLSGLVIACAVFFSASAVHAETTSQGLNLGVDYGAATGLGDQDIRVVIAQIIRVGLGILGTLALVIFIYAGVLYMTSKGEADVIEKAKKMMVQALIGLLIILSSYSIVLFIFCNLFGFCPDGQGVTYGGASNTYDSTLPNGARYLVVTSRYPERNPINPVTVARNTKISVTFNENLDPDSVKLLNDPSTLNQSTRGVGDQCTAPTVSIEYYDPTNPSDPWQDIFGAVVVRGNAMTFASSAPCGDSNYDAPGVKCEFAGGATCNPAYGNPTCCGCLLPASKFTGPESIQVRVTLNRSVRATSGKTLATDEQWEFKVENRLDTVQPQIKSILPVNDTLPDDAAQGRVPRNIGVQVLFDKPIDPTTLVTFEEGMDGTATPSVRVTKKNASGADELVRGKITASVDSFIFRPSTPCPTDQGAGGCFCFDPLTTFKIELLGKVEKDAAGNTLSTPVPGVRDNSCNALKCDGGVCESRFRTSQNLDLTPPTIATLDVSGTQVLGINPIDTPNRLANADRVANVYMSVCDKTDPNSPGCDGDVNMLSLNLDSFVLRGTDGSLYTGLPRSTATDEPPVNLAQCCFAADGGSCVGGNRPMISCPSVTAANRTTSANIMYDPYVILDALRQYSATLYGGGSSGGSCSSGINSWGVQDAAGNSLYMEVEGNRLPNADWNFTTSKVANAGAPYIDRIAPAAGYREQCISIIGANFGDARSIAPLAPNTGSATPGTATIVYRNEDGWPCNNSLAAQKNPTDPTCKAEVQFQGQVLDAGGVLSTVTTSSNSIYKWTSNEIVASVPAQVQLSKGAQGIDQTTRYSVFLNYTW